METTEILSQETNSANFSKRNVYLSLGVFIILLSIGVFAYTKHIEKTNVIPVSKLEENAAYNEAYKLQDKDPKKAAELINSIDVKSGDFTAKERVELLSRRKGINSLASNSKEYIDTLKMGITDLSLTKQFRSRNYEYVAIMLETIHGNKDIFSYVQTVFPEVKNKNILEAQMYFLQKAEEINKTPYQDLYRARFTLYGVDKNSSKEVIATEIEKAISYITLVEKIKDTLPDVPEKTNLNNQLSYTKAFVTLYSTSVLSNPTPEKKYGTTLDTSRLMFTSSQSESRSQTRALMFYITALTLSPNTHSDLTTKIHEVLKKNSTIPGLLDDAKGISSEIKRHLGDSVAEDIIKKFPEAKPYFAF